MKGPQDSIPFHPYYTVKDMYGLGVFMLFYAFWVFFAPVALGDPRQLHPGQSALDAGAHRAGMVLPAVLRDSALDPDKLTGVLAMGASIAVLFILPWLDRSPVRSGAYRPAFKRFSGPWSSSARS